MKEGLLREVERLNNEVRGGRKHQRKEEEETP